MDKINFKIYGDDVSGFLVDNKESKVCNHHEHNPPQHLYIPAGKTYKHICPSCSKETVVSSLNIMY
jgi:hypothetical protein